MAFRTFTLESKNIIQKKMKMKNKEKDIKVPELLSDEKLNLKLLKKIVKIM